MAMKSKPFILASASPSRKMLLERAGVEFEVVVSGAEETVPETYGPVRRWNVWQNGKRKRWQSCTQIRLS